MKDRSQLRFEKETQSAFAFLEKVFHFSRISTSARKVRYESDKVYIQIEHGDYDFGISLFFGRLERVVGQTEMYDICLFLQLVNPALDKTFGDMVAGTSDKVRTTVQQIAAALRSEGIDIIKGRDAVFDQMKNVAWWQFGSAE